LPLLHTHPLLGFIRAPYLLSVCNTAASEDFAYLGQLDACLNAKTPPAHKALLAAVVILHRTHSLEGGHTCTASTRHSHSLTPARSLKFTSACWTGTTKLQPGLLLLCIPLPLLHMPLLLLLSAALTNSWFTTNSTTQACNTIPSLRSSQTQLEATLVCVQTGTNTIRGPNTIPSLLPLQSQANSSCTYNNKYHNPPPPQHHYLEPVHPMS
jgi:hypothetical protein